MPSSADTALLEDRFGLVGTELERKFRVERRVAEGGFGVVYAGRHIGLDAPIAIKVLKTPPDLSEAAKREFIAKFVLEARTIARIKHPNIVQVLDTGVTVMPSGEQAPWMVLEWLTGETLEQMLHARRGQGGCTPFEAVRLMRPVLDALAYAHDEGVVHRDIKPGNVMLVPSKRGVMARLLDFGIAKIMRESESAASSGFTATRSTVNAFSPNYAAPEQIGGARTGPWTDVHAVGLILTELLTDQTPFGSDEITELYQQALSPVRPTPAKYGVDVGALETVLARAVAFKPDERFPHAQAFLDALDAAIPALPNSGGTGPHPAVPATGAHPAALGGATAPTEGARLATATTDTSGAQGLAPLTTPETGCAHDGAGEVAFALTTLRGAAHARAIDTNGAPPRLDRARSRRALVGGLVAVVATLAFIGTYAGLSSETATRASESAHSAAPIPSTSIAGASLSNQGSATTNAQTSVDAGTRRARPAATAAARAGAPAHSRHHTRHEGSGSNASPNVYTVE